MKRQLIATAILVLVITIVITMYMLQIPSVSGIERFKGIPEKPNDFDAYTRDIWKGAFVELCDLPEEYWKQPEFYGSSWENGKEKFYDNPNYGMWGVYGQGNIPREIGYTFTNLKKGDEFELCTFFHNGFGVWTYQGFKLIPYGENEYFEIEITPNEFTVFPTFPVFEDGWTKKINIKIKVKEIPPQGTYILGFTSNAPSEEYAREMTKQILKLEVDKTEYYDDCVKYLKDTNRCDYLINQREKKYVNGGSYQSNVEPLKITLVVK